MEKKIFDFGGDMTMILKGPANVDISDMNYFDELEYDCFELIKKYAAKFGYEVEGLKSENDIDFYAAKEVQDKIIDLFKEAGVLFSTNEQQEISNRYPFLIGYADDIRKQLHGIEEVADFICEQGETSDVIIIKPNGDEFLSTCGIYVDQISDMEYREQLLKVLIPKQQELDGSLSDNEESEGMGGMNGM